MDVWVVLFREDSVNMRVLCTVAAAAAAVRYVFVCQRAQQQRITVGRANEVAVLHAGRLLCEVCVK